jgi:hypothetical protein
MLRFKIKRFYFLKFLPSVASSRAVPCVQNVTEIKARHEHATVITWFSVHLADFLLASDWCVFNCWV